MNFEELMNALAKAKNDAKQLGMNDHEIRKLKVIDVGILNSIKEWEFDISIAQNKSKKYLLLKLK